jgi:hypothetical protein
MQKIPWWAGRASCADWHFSCLLFHSFIVALLINVWKGEFAQGVLKTCNYRQ